MQCMLTVNYIYCNNKIFICWFGHVYSHTIILMVLFACFVKSNTKAGGCCFAYKGVIYCAPQSLTIKVQPH